MMAALVVSGVAGAGFMANEMTHGGMAETMGMGHHHLADYGGYHCASHDGSEGMHHMEHMHGENFTAHSGCNGGAPMHGDRMGGMQGGMMHG